MSEDGSDLLRPPPSVTLRSERLLLSTLRMSDLHDLMPILTSRDVMQWTSAGPVANEHQGKSWLSTRALGADVFNFAIRLRDKSDRNERQGAIIGIMGSPHWPEVGYLIHPSYAGKGYGSEALSIFIPAYFERVPKLSDGHADVSGAHGTGYDHLEAFVDVENIASQRVLEKCGFTKVMVSVNDFENSMGLRSTALFRIARPGSTLAELSLVTVDSNPADPWAEGAKPPIA